MKRFNLFGAVTYYSVNSKEISRKTRRKIKKDGYDINDKYFDMCENDIFLYNIPYEAVEWGSERFESDEVEGILNSFMGKEYPHYLAYAKECTWDKRSEYKFYDKLGDTIRRGYETTIEIIEAGTRYIRCVESSYNVPCGYNLYIVGITEKEYTKLSSTTSDNIKDFVFKMEFKNMTVKSNQEKAQRFNIRRYYL